MYNIQNTVREILELHMAYEEDFFDDEFDDFTTLNKCDLKIANTLCRKSDNQWDTKMLYSGYKIIEKYKDMLDSLNINFEDIEKPCFETYQIEKNCNALNIYDKEYNLSLDKKFLNDKFTKIIKVSNEYFVFPINLHNIYEITKLFKNKKINIPLNIINRINIFLNNYNYNEKDIKNFSIENSNYDIQLLNFQKIGTLFGIINKGIILADEMGLGKTIQALSILTFIESKKNIIVCPKSLKYKWEKECKKTFYNNIVIFDKNKTKNLDNSDIIICTYDNIKDAIIYFEKMNNIDSVVFDESHYLKNRKTIRSRCCYKLATKSEYVIGLTGSPMLNRVSELCHQIEIIDKMHIFGSNFDFNQKYCMQEKIRKDEIVEEDFYRRQEENLNELSFKMRENFYLRRNKKQVLKDLPDKQRSYIYLDIDNKKEYNNKIKEYRKAQTLSEKKRILAKLNEISAEGKYYGVRERINDFIENEEKVVVFAYHKKMQKKLIDDYPDALRITSDQTSEERHKNEQEFLKNPNKKIIICSIKVAYYGFDLFSSSQMIFAEMDWVPEINKQCEDRIHRIGQDTPVNIWYIIAKNTVDEKILKINKEKNKIIKTVNKDIPDDIIKISSTLIKEEIIKDLDSEI
tara:strand:- start:77862 stop:79751 length:1890 start_codon:yes stop_codon:yes gene_type:complete